MNEENNLNLQLYKKIKGLYNVNPKRYIYIGTDWGEKDFYRTEFLKVKLKNGESCKELYFDEYEEEPKYNFNPQFSFIYSPPKKLEKSKQEIFQDTVIKDIFNETYEKIRKQRTETINNFIKTNLNKLGCNVENEEETKTFIEENNIRLEWIKIEKLNAWGIVLYKGYKEIDEILFKENVEVKIYNDNTTNN